MTKEQALYGDDWEASDYDEKLPKQKMESAQRKGEASRYSSAFEIKKFVKDTDGTINTEIDQTTNQCKISIPSKKKEKEQPKDPEKKRNLKAVSKESKNKLEHQLKVTYGKAAMKMMAKMGGKLG